MQSRYLYALRLVLALTDILFVNIAFFLAFRISNSYDKGLYLDSYRQYLLNVNLIWLVSSSTVGLYLSRSITELVVLYRQTWKCIFVHLLLFICCLLFSKDQQISRLFLILFYATVGFNFLFSRFMCTVLEPILARKYRIRRSVAVIGRSEAGLALAQFIENKCKQYHFEGFLDEEDSYHVNADGALVPSLSEQIKGAAEKGITEVYVSLQAGGIAGANSLVHEAEKHCIRLKFVPDFGSTLSHKFRFNTLGDFPVINIGTEPLEEIHNRFRKRVFDIVFSLIIIFLVISWLYPIIAALIKFQSKGPVLFKQIRSGRNNDLFWCYKFRSMMVNDESDKLQARKGDQRITPIGAFLRKTSLDELPQFFNVLLGNMSVVGPRPHMRMHTEQYSKIIDKYMVRHHSKPGITGWAQVNGFRGETRDSFLMEKRIEHDLWYLENWSMMLDLKIVFLTINSLIRGDKNAC